MSEEIKKPKMSKRTSFICGLVLGGTLGGIILYVLYASYFKKKGIDTKSCTNGFMIGIAIVVAIGIILRILSGEF